MNYRKIIFYLILICVFGFVLGNKQNSLASNQVIRVLFIGNSLTTFNDMPSRVEKMGSMAKEKISIETFMIASGGDSLDRIVKSRMSSHSKYFKSIESKKWDYIVLQDHSKAPISGRNQMIKAAEILVKINQKNSKYRKIDKLFFQHLLNFIPSPLGLNKLGVILERRFQQFKTLLKLCLRNIYHCLVIVENFIFRVI